MAKESWRLEKEQMVRDFHVWNKDAVKGRLKAEYTIEGMHIKPEGYRAIFDDVMKYVME